MEDSTPRAPIGFRQRLHPFGCTIALLIRRQLDLTLDRRHLASRIVGLTATDRGHARCVRRQCVAFRVDQSGCREPSHHGLQLLSKLRHFFTDDV